MSTAVPSPHTIIEVATAFWRSTVLLTAVDLGVFAHLAKQPRDLAGLCAELDVKGRGARDFFDALVAMGFLEREEGLYRNSPAADRYLDPAKPQTCVAGYLEFLHSGFTWWSRLGEGLRSGDRLDFSVALAKAGSNAADPEAAREALVAADSAADTFGEAYAAPQQVIGFLRAMTGYSMGANEALATRFPWAEYRTVVDVGCAEGSLLAHVLDRNPHLAGVGFDLPVVADGFNDYARQLGMTERMRFEGGDFFQRGFPRADVVVLGHVLHDWDTETKKLLLRKAFEAVPSGGAVVVYESLIDDDRRANLGGMLTSVNVSLVSAGGLGYTGAECQEWLREAGFTETRVEHLDGPEHVVVGIRR